MTTYGTRTLAHILYDEIARQTLDPAERLRVLNGVAKLSGAEPSVVEEVRSWIWAEIDHARRLAAEIAAKRNSRW